MNRLYAPPLQSAITTAAVFDGDNIFRRGRDRISPNYAALAKALQGRGVQATTICQNFFTPEDRAAVRCLPRVYGLATRENCDKIAMLVAIEYAMGGLDWLILGSGDEDYLPLVEALQHAGTRVEIWCRRKSAAGCLTRRADSIRWIDSLVLEQVDVAVSMPHQSRGEAA